LSEDPPIGKSDQDQLVVPLHAEQVEVGRVEREKGQVKISTVTRFREHVVDEMLSKEYFDVKHVAVDRIVDAMPDIRQEGDTTIVPIVEEVLVIEKRLRVKQEVHITRIKTTARHQETIVLREQEAVVTRTGENAVDDKKDVSSNKNGDDDGK
jgi:stress response protein YsnF